MNTKARPVRALAPVQLGGERPESSKSHPMGQPPRIIRVHWWRELEAA